jgi:hypothetical protein
MRTEDVSADELHQAKALLLRQLPSANPAKTP